MGDTKTVYKRSELYEQVWSEPLTKLAPRYGVSDVALAKTCRRLGIPLPGRGHWTQIACGHLIARPPLPPAGSGQPEQLVVEVREPVARAAPANPLPIVKVADQLRNPHPLVQATRASLKDGKADYDGRRSGSSAGGLNVIVGTPSVGRALRILDAILKHLESEGHQILVKRGDGAGTYVRVGGRDVELQLREGVIRTERLPTKEDPYPYPRYNGTPNGLLTLEIKEFLDGERKTWADGNGSA